MHRRASDVAALLRRLPLLALTTLQVGCGSTDAPTRPEPAPPRPEEQQCPAGQVVGPQGGCMAVGIQGCAELFMGADNLCHPSTALCPGGTIAKLDEGCVPVGIPSCAPVFLEADGLCHPSMAKCPAGTFAVPQEGCVPIDGPEGCGDGAWGSLTDAPGTIYVDPSSPQPSGDGTRASPVKTITEALALVQSGGRIALAAGTYDEPVAIDRTLELVGRCPSMVRIQGTQISRPYTAAIVVSDAPRVALRRLTVGGRGIGVLAENAPDLTIEQVHIDRATSVGVMAELAGTTVTITRSWIGDLVEGGSIIAGLFATAGADVLFESSVVAGVPIAGLQAQGIGSSIVANNSLVEDIGAGAAGLFGLGFIAAQGAKLEITRTAVARTRSEGVAVSGRGSAGAIQESIIESTSPPRANSTSARGVVVERGARAALGGVVIQRAKNFGVLARDEGTSVEIDRSLMQGTQSTGALDVSNALGVCAQQGAHLSLTATTVVGNAFGGVRLMEGATGALELNLIEGNVDAERLGAFGLDIVGSQATLTSSAIVGNQGAGLIVTDGATLLAEGNLVDRTAPFEDLRFGRGLDSSNAAEITLRANAWLGNHEHGVNVHAGATGAVPVLRMAGELVQGTQPSGNGTWGVGAFFGGALVTIEASVFRDNAAAAVLVAASTADIRGSLFETVRPGAAPRAGGIVELGDGLIATGSTLRLSSTKATGCSRAGLLSEDTGGTISGAIASDNRYGLVLQGGIFPELSPDNTITGNTEHDIVRGIELAVPDGYSEVP